MGPIPEKPAGCEITETTGATGVTFSWPAYKAEDDQPKGTWLLALWLCGWVIGLLFALGGILGGGASAGAYIWFALWTFGGGAGTVSLWRMFRAPTPESVRLDADKLSYDPGRGPDSARSCAELPSGKVVPVTPAPAMEVAKADIERFGVDRVNERQRLYLDLDGRRVEIGGCLTESEREWLFGVLRQWLGKPSAPPAWSREARRNKEEAQP